MSKDLHPWRPPTAPIERDEPDAPVQPVEDEVAVLRAEVADLHRAMATRPAIDQVKGMVMVTLGLGPDEAFAFLVRLSQHHNVKLRDLAHEVVAALGHGEPRSPAAATPAGGALLGLLARGRGGDDDVGDDSSA